MGSFHLPVSHAVAQVRGAAAGAPVSVPSIHAGDTLLAVMAYAPGAGAAGLDPSAFTVSEGSIESASVDTAGQFLIVVHTTS